MNSTDVCATAKLYADSTLVAFADFGQVFFSTLGLIAILMNLPFKYFEHRPMAIHQNLKVRKLGVSKKVLDHHV